jgi:hypothetical protein
VKTHLISIPINLEKSIFSKWPSHHVIPIVVAFGVSRARPTVLNQFPVILLGPEKEQNREFGQPRTVDVCPKNDRLSSALISEIELSRRFRCPYQCLALIGSSVYSSPEIKLCAALIEPETLLADSLRGNAVGAVIENQVLILPNHNPCRSLYLAVVGTA